MARVSGYRGYAVIGEAIKLRKYLDPEIFRRLVHEGPSSNAEADNILTQLRELSEKVTPRRSTK